VAARALRAHGQVQDRCKFTANRHRKLAVSVAAAAPDISLDCFVF